VVQQHPLKANSDEGQKIKAEMLVNPAVPDPEGFERLGFRFRFHSINSMPQTIPKHEATPASSRV
jgi:hypothetical protein